MKNKELIEALQKLNPEAEVLINIKQWNKSYGRRLPVEGSKDHWGNWPWVEGNYSGATITVHLPTGYILARTPAAEKIWE